MKRKKARVPKAGADLSEDSAGYDPVSVKASVCLTVELAAGGRVVIPAPVRAALGMKVGDRLTLRLDGSELRIHTYEEGVRQARAILAKYLPPSVDPVDDFLGWRREQAKQEEAKHEKWSRRE